MPRSQVHILAGLAIMSFAVGCNSSQTDQQPLTVKPQPPNYGKFLGHVRTEWIDEPDGRLMCLLENYGYLDPDGKLWIRRQI